MKIFLKIFGIAILIAVVIGTSSFLFFPDFTVKTYNNLLTTFTQKHVEASDVLDIAFLFAPSNLYPFTTNETVRSRLNDIYESLVTTNKDLNIQPDLAIQFGKLDNKTYQFKLRSGVTFQNGKKLNTDDVIYSFKTAQNDKHSELKDLLSDISLIKKTANDTIVITTSKTDPLFLMKVAKVMIVPKNFKNFSAPIGTGPYRMQKTSNLKDISYIRNDNFWGIKPYFKKVKIVSIPSKNKRVQDLINKNIDLLADVPPDAVSELQKNNGLKVKTVPSLEVDSLMFNLHDKNFSKLNLRKAIAEGINKKSLLSLTYNQAKTVNQFISSGVFGFDPNIKGFSYNLKAAQNEYHKTASPFEKLKVNFYFPKNLNLLGGYIKDQLAPVGFDLILHPVSEAKLEDLVKSGKASFYYLGWKNDLADGIFFLKNIVHSKKGQYGLLNGEGYSNSKMDSLIEKSEHNLNIAQRLKDMQTVMQQVVEKDIIGVPLFETNSIFAYQSNLNFLPRVDSEIYPAQISRKQ